MSGTRIKNAGSNRTHLIYFGNNDAKIKRRIRRIMLNAMLAKSVGGEASDTVKIDDWRGTDKELSEFVRAAVNRVCPEGNFVMTSFVMQKQPK